jgi:hypothetical protein
MQDIITCNSELRNAKDPVDVQYFQKQMKFLNDYMGDLRKDKDMWMKREDMWMKRDERREEFLQQERLLLLKSESKFYFCWPLRTSMYDLLFINSFIILFPTRCLISELISY